MGRILRVDKINQLVVDSATVIRLPSENIVTILGQQFTVTDLTMNSAVTGVGGLDVGPLVADSFYNVFVVNTGAVRGLVASLGSTPVGFNLYTLVGVIATNANADILSAGTPETKPLFQSITESARENIADFSYQSTSQIFMPSSSILIGTAGGLVDAKLYTSANLIFDFANGTGDNGLDTGSEAAWQWYALYAIPSGSSYILKATNRNPVTQPGPTGQTQWRYLGMFRNGAILGAANDIAQFRKLGSKISFHYSTDLTAQGIQYDGGSGVASVNTTLNLGYNMNGQDSIPFNGSMYGWGLVHMHSASFNEPISLSAMFWNSGTSARSGSVSTGMQNFNGPHEAYNELWCSTADSPNVLTRTAFAAASSTFSWSLNLKTLFDPILGRSINKV